MVPVPSTWPCTRCPPSRPSSRIGRSRLTGSPAASAPRQLRSRVSRITSAVNPVAVASTTVRHTPLTAIESPCAASVDDGRAAHGQAHAVAQVGQRDDLAELLDDAGEHQASPVPLRRTGRAATRTSGPQRVTSVTSSRDAVGQRADAGAGQRRRPRRRAASAPGRRRPGRPARPGRTRRPASGRPRAAPGRGPGRAGPAAAQPRSTRPSASGAQLGGGRDPASAPSRPAPARRPAYGRAVSTTTRSGCSPDRRPGRRRGPSARGSSASTVPTPATIASHSARSRCASARDSGRGDPAAGPVGGGDPAVQGGGHLPDHERAAQPYAGQPALVGPLRLGGEQARPRRRRRPRAAARPPPPACAVRVGDGVDDAGDAGREQRLGARPGAAGVRARLEGDDQRCRRRPGRRPAPARRPRRAGRRPARAGPRPRPRRPGRGRQRRRSGWDGWPRRPTRTARRRGASPLPRARLATRCSLCSGALRGSAGKPACGRRRVAGGSRPPTDVERPACCLPSGLSPSVPEFHRVNRPGRSHGWCVPDAGRGLSPPVRNLTDPGARCASYLSRPVCHAGAAPRHLPGRASGPAALHPKHRECGARSGEGCRP